MRILVTGGTGFIGSHLADHLIESGYNVFIIDDFSTGHERNLNKKAEFFKGSICDYAFVENVFIKAKPEVVYHLAAQVNVRFSLKDPIKDASINIIGSLNMIENSLKARSRLFVYASTGGAIYGEQKYYPADEDHPTRPESPYGVAKLTIEHYLEYFRIIQNLNYKSLRLANVYGPRQDPKGEAGVVAIFLSKMLANQTPVIYGDGEQTRDFVHVDDVVQAFMLALDGSTGIYNIGTGFETSVNKLFKLLSNQITFDAEGVMVQGTYQGKPRYDPPIAGELLRSCLSFDKARKILGWYPHVELADGLKQTAAFFMKHPCHL